jgi:fumarylpyruvate hydrolase
MLKFGRCVLPPNNSMSSAWGLQQTLRFSTPSFQSLSLLATQVRTMTTKFAFEPLPTPTVPIVGTTQEVFPVHRIYCVGRNYADHVKEMGGDTKKNTPIFFTKPADAVVASGSQVKYPLATTNLHYEVELVVAIGTGGVQISQPDALTHVFGYAVGIDLTRRDLQNQAKAKGMPWDTAKAFDESAPIGAITKTTTNNNGTMDKMGDETMISLTVNQETKQSAKISEMIWSVPEIVSILSHQFRLQPGDLIFTGTPSGVGPLQPGDQVQASVEGLTSVEITIVE